MITPSKPLPITGERRWVIDAEKGKLIPLGMYQRQQEENDNEEERKASN